MPTNLNYYHNGETTDFSFFRIPRALVKDERFRDLSTDAKLLYGLMLDRMGLSLQNGWQDAEGRTFIYFTLEEIQTTLSCSHNKAVRLMAELEQYDLIERTKQGQGKPAKIYIKKIDADNTDERTSGQTPEPPNQPTSRRRKNRPVDFPFQNVWTSLKGTEIILIRTILSSAISIHLSILTTHDRPYRRPKNHLRPTHPTRTAPPPALSQQVCHLLNTNDRL